MPEESRLFREQTKQLGAWFLGPKAENAAFEAVGFGLGGAAAAGWIKGAEGAYVPSVMVLR